MILYLWKGARRMHHNKTCQKFLLYLMLISCNFIGQLFVWKFWMLHSFYKRIYREGNIQKKCWLREKDARTVQIEKPMADVAAFWATS